ncbi:unnamed protein product [Eruca vesicaria subsp. sativa]|uniref:Uncharacterized protein n=1 Tax=Eruca vesicaria subsp. sativa TaxID=29727 RepID=A0ABC8KQX2_ERUVS|nr:unnamed protein product [Eruca vesicaria subsp. sativa]
MEGVGGRLGRSSTRYGGPATVFTGPVRKWKKKWVHVSPSSAKKHNHSSAASDSADGSHLLFFKWAPLSQNGNGNEDGKSESLSPSEDPLVVAAAEEDPPRRRRFKYVPIAVLEEQKNEVTEIEEDDKVEEEDDKIEEEENKENEEDASAAEPSEKKAQVEEKPDMNDVPMDDNQEEEKTVRQDLNESTKDSGLNLNANDVDVDSENNPKGAESH